MEAARRRCVAAWMGRVPYAEAVAIQEARVADLARGRADESLLLLEHPHVITLGRNADSAHVVAGEAARQHRGVALYRTGRGGDVTYHGPGQLVGYPILDLKPDRCDVRRYVRDIEEVMIRTAVDFAVTAVRIDGLSGVWVGREKLGAVGVRIARWITSHGFAFNVSTDLSYFGLIVPCGIADRGVTSLERLTGRRVALEEVARRAAAHLGAVLGREMVTPAEAAA
jgi:lipoyl(octanoyl) transferase